MVITYLIAGCGKETWSDPSPTSMVWLYVLAALAKLVELAELARPGLELLGCKATRSRDEDWYLLLSSREHRAQYQIAIFFTLFNLFTWKFSYFSQPKRQKDFLICHSWLLKKCRASSSISLYLTGFTHVIGRLSEERARYSRHCRKGRWLGRHKWRWHRCCCAQRRSLELAGHFAFFFNT